MARKIELGKRLLSAAVSGPRRAGALAARRPV